MELAENRYCYCCPYDHKAKLVLSSLNTLQYAELEQLAVHARPQSPVMATQGNDIFRWALRNDSPVNVGATESSPSQ
jgi:hypothetical protein